MSKTWQDTNTLYHIYPRSFQDTNDDGIGDIPGITSRLDYLSTVLGVEAIWLSPFFTSPMRDFGYDVADYRQVSPDYGTLDDFKKLLDEAHRRNIKVMIDFVPCHTSDQHPWFTESRSSRDSPKREYYTWCDAGPNGEAPNNWLSQSGGTSWTFDETTGQYYLHSFLSSQPDLNWDNPELRKEMTSTVRWWFDLGVDGMRVDAIWGISKDSHLADDPINPEFSGDMPSEYGHFIHNKCKYGPNFVSYLRELSDVCHEFIDKQMIFEFYPDDKIGDFYEQYHQVATEVNPDVASTFFMELIRSPWHADMLLDGIDRYVNYAAKDALPVFCLGNHDQPRIVSRIGYEKARAMAVLNLTLPGLSVIYYGDELGIENGTLEPHQVRDTFSPVNTSDTTRDLERTPMQWDATSYAGFSQATPWLPVNSNHKTINAMSELTDPKSMLTLYRRLIRLRKQHALLRAGSFEKISVNSGYVLAFKRELGEDRFYIAINFADQPQTIQLPEACTPLMSSIKDISHQAAQATHTTLDAFEAVVFTI